MYGFTASYDLGNLSAVAGFQQNDVSGKKFNLFNLGAVYAVTPAVKLLAGWMHAQDNTGLTDVDMQQSGAPALAHVSSNRIDDSFYVGSTWQVTSPLALALAGYYDHARDAATLDGTLGSGVPQMDGFPVTDVRFLVDARETAAPHRAIRSRGAAASLAMKHGVALTSSPASPAACRR